MKVVKGNFLKGNEEKEAKAEEAASKAAGN